MAGDELELAPEGLGICLWLLLLAGMIALIVRRTGMRCLERVV